MRRPIVFVTDYGRDDAYAAALIGAVWSVEPMTVVVEGTHGIPPGDILAGAYQLKALAEAFDENAVFCAVVDPGVGTDRKALAVQIGDLVCVAPDNGLITYLWAEAPINERWAVSLDIPEGASNTFHGRDVFAPAAGQIVGGERLEEMGDPIDAPVLLPEAFAQRQVDRVVGRVAVVDHFGNVISTIRGQDLSGASVVSVQWPGGSTNSVVSTYAEIGEGVAALFGSVDHLEIAARGAPAASKGGPQAGDEITVMLM
ncbi:MAG: SAM-dependent chlorinase/fluorinase [Candidatus Dormibacteraeota bacterium]|nr:SAM-dependent chlorinase/fluorinase [Candidatus Dormibacteraeota bacterium]